MTVKLKILVAWKKNAALCAHICFFKHYGEGVGREGGGGGGSRLTIYCLRLILLKFKFTLYCFFFSRIPQLTIFTWINVTSISNIGDIIHWLQESPNTIEVKWNLKYSCYRDLELR